MKSSQFLFLAVLLAGLGAEDSKTVLGETKTKILKFKDQETSECILGQDWVR